MCIVCNSRPNHYYSGGIFKNFKICRDRTSLIDLFNIRDIRFFSLSGTIKYYISLLLLRKRSLSAAVKRLRPHAQNLSSNPCKGVNELSVGHSPLGR